MQYRRVTPFNSSLNNVQRHEGRTYDDERFISFNAKVLEVMHSCHQHV